MKNPYHEWLKNQIHRCGYPGCETVITMDRFLCRAHWGNLSSELKVNLNIAYNFYIRNRDEERLAKLRKVQGECLRFLIGRDLEETP